ncbi:MAG TPA: TolC family protein [Candidatus Sulfopaludibacter sp.]|jgi:outer membrane protein TolC|nr:TolC family protein [Candidatus Sulfopaludibacter sp.]
MTHKQILSVLLASMLCAAAPQQPMPPITTPVNLDNSQRIHDLIRAGNLYLSLQDALALAIENNLDIELQRYNLPIAGTDLLRTRGGGINRGLNFSLLEVPAGVGGPLSPLVVNRANTGTATAGTSVAANALELGVLGEPLINLSMQGTIGQSNGTAVPLYDPAVVGQLNWAHQTTPETSILSTGSNTLVTNTVTANAGLQQGFSTGAQASVNFNNSHQNVNALTTGINPYTGSSLGFNVTQPLLRGFGMSLNRRFIRIAGNEQRITGLLFQQQLIQTVYGVIRLYTDFVALYEDEKVKQETVSLAEKLLSDTRAQVEEGTLAQVELTRANAQLFSTRQDLINASGLREEEEAILKTVLTRNKDQEIRSARIVPTDALSIPATDEIRPIQDLISDAIANRPDLGQARLQVANSIIGLQGAKNATLPEVDLVGGMQNNGLNGAATGFNNNTNPAFYGGYGGVLGQILARDYPTYGIGLQVTLPIHNRIAEADLARDEIQVKQSQVRVKQLQNQAQLEVEDAVIAMRRSRFSYEAAVQARKFQQESLEAEQAKFEVGASTAFFVIQYESLLAQARSTEVAAMSSYVKAKAALQRATGTILDQNNVSIDAAIKGKIR